MEKISVTLLAIVSGAIGLAIVSVVLAQRAQTPQVLGAAGGALSEVIAAAVAPITGASTNSFGAAASGALGGFHMSFP